jgi:hypothetical protein
LGQLRSKGIANPVFVLEMFVLMQSAAWAQKRAADSRLKLQKHFEAHEQMVKQHEAIVREHGELPDEFIRDADASEFDLECWQAEVTAADEIVQDVRKEVEDLKAKMTDE